MNISDIKNAKGARKYYGGFGTYKTAAEWARALGLPRMTVWQYLQQGLTPEEIQARREVTKVELATGPRKKRIGHRQRETIEMVEGLLDVSGYDPEGLEGEVVSKAAFRHKITWSDTLVGKYDPTKDVLQLSGGDTLKLRNPLTDDLKIHHVEGVWFITPETKQAIISAEPWNKTT